MTMFDGLQAIGAAWRTVAHLSEWAGLSVGALIGCGVLIYLEPTARKLAIGAGGVVLIGWACLVHGHAVGVADRDAQLQTISDQGDARAAARAKEDEAERVSAIEAKAKEQHAKDWAEIERLKKVGGAPGCGFDPGTIDGRVYPSTGKAGAVNGNAQPTAGPWDPHEGAVGAAPGRGLHLPLVWGRWLSRKGHSGNASSDGE